MSIGLLKRELEKELETMENKKQKTDKTDLKRKDRKKVAKKKHGAFKFNDKDHSKEDDYTLDSLKSIGLPDMTFPTVYLNINKNVINMKNIY